MKVCELIADEEELLRQALLTHGTDMDKLCEALPARTEQAIRAAVKRKMDPDLVQRLGPLKRRRTAPLPEAIQESSPLASYFQTKSQPSVPLAPVVGDVVAKDGEGIKPAPGRPVPYINGCNHFSVVLYS